MVKIKLFIPLFISTMLLSITNCTSSENSISTISATATVTVQQTIHITSTALTATIPSTSPTTTEPFVNQCVKLAEGVPPPVESSNNWLLLRTEQASYSPFLMNPANGIKNAISDNNIIQIYVSPDQKKLAYDTYSQSHSDNNKLVITNAEGKLLENFPNEQSWTFFWGWLDDQHLITTNNAPGDESVPSLTILNIVDRTTYELSPDFPNFDNINYLPWQHNRVIYDPELQVAAYPSFGEKNGTITLFDLVSKKEIINFPAFVSQTAQPVWSPNGEYLTAAETVVQRSPYLPINEQYDQELILIDKNGNISHLTRFTDKYANSHIGNVSWSPNGQYIAFWLSLGQSLNEELLVLDLQSKIVKNYCVQGYSKTLGNSPRPIWSPDSRIVLVNSKESTDAPVKAIWVDIANDQAGTIGSGISVEGWLTMD